MAGSFSVGGLITGLDTNNIIRQLMQIERQPIIRLQERISVLQRQRESIRALRTQLFSLRSRAQDFRLTNIFDQHAATSSAQTVLLANVSGASPAAGSYSVNVLQLASATVAVSNGTLGAAILTDVPLNSSGISTEVTAGTFTINGVAFAVDPSADSLDTILANINASAAGVTATYNAATDKVTFTNSTPGDTSIINLGASGDDSNFLSAIRVIGATQSTGVGGSTEVTSTRNLGAVNPAQMLNAVNFAAGAMTSGSFRINGITITVDVTQDSLSDVLAAINASDAAVTATYDTATDAVRLVSKTLGSRTIAFMSGTSNFLDVVKLTTATQTAGNDSQITVNGGAVQTRNTNQITDAIGDVTLNLLGAGVSTVTVSLDNDAIVESVRAFVNEFNQSLTALHNVRATEPGLAGDHSFRMIDNFLRTAIFSQVSGITGNYSSLAQIGITTGQAFDSEAVPQLVLDEDIFREALQQDLANVHGLFANVGESGVADQIFDYLDEVTSISGYLNERVRTGGSIDDRIRMYNDRIDRMTARLAQREARLRAQFSRLEQLTSGYQSQNTVLAGLITSFSQFRWSQQRS